MIPYGRQEITQADIQAVTEVLHSDFLTQGPVVPRFEEKLALRCAVGFAVAANSATSALHLACLSLGLGPGDWLWTSPISFVASANCGLYCGAKVDFVDIDPLTYNMSVDCLEQKLIDAEKGGTLPKVLVPVHLCGQPCDMAAIYSLGKRYGFAIIEDASHAIGAMYKGAPIGNCHFSDVTIFSFHPVKIITTGEGGVALTNSPELAVRMRQYRSHGITNIATEMEPHPETEIWNYQQISLGYNYRMTDIQAALGISQMDRLDDYINQRHRIAEHYNIELADFSVTIPWQHPDGRSSYHLYPIRVKAGVSAAGQRTVYKTLLENGIAANLHYIPIYKQPFYRAFGFDEGYCQESERYFREAISLPIFPSMTDKQQEKIIDVLRKVLKNETSNHPGSWG